MKNKFAALVMLFAFLWLASCGGKEGTGNAPAKGSVDFNSFAVEIGKDGTDTIHRASLDSRDWLSVEIKDLPEETDYGAVYDNKLYYADARVGYETGETSKSEVQIFCCDLTNQETKTVLVLADVSAITRIIIREGFLFCSWVTTEDVSKYTSVDLLSGSATEFLMQPAAWVAAVTASGYYCQDLGDLGTIYFSAYEGGERQLFCKVPGELEALYRNEGEFCALTQQEEGIALMVLDDTGTLKKEYKGLENVDGLAEGRSVEFVRAEGNILYYLLHATLDGSMNNTFLIRANLEDGIKEICGGWYMP